MKKAIMVALALVLVVPLFVAFASPALACVDGKSPGYWKNHTGAWPTIYTIEGVDYTLSPNTHIGDVFPGLKSNDYNNVTLLAALQTGGGGRAAFWRQAVAQLLNSAVGDLKLAQPARYHVDWLIGCVIAIYPDGGEYHNGSTNPSDSSWDLEDWKDYFEGYNT